MNKKIMKGTAYALCAALAMTSLPSLAIYANIDLLTGEPLYARMGNIKHNSGEEVIAI